MENTFLQYEKELVDNILYFLYLNLVFYFILLWCEDCTYSVRMYFILFIFKSILIAKCLVI